MLLRYTLLVEDKDMSLLDHNAEHFVDIYMPQVINTCMNGHNERRPT